MLARRLENNVGVMEITAGAHQARSLRRCGSLTINITDTPATETGGSQQLFVIKVLQKKIFCQKSDVKCDVKSVCRKQCL